MPLPTNIEKLLRTAAQQRADLETEEASARIQASLEQSLRAARRADERARLLPIATAVEGWLLGPDAARLLSLAHDARVRELLLLGPVLENGTDSDGRTGSWSIHLAAGPTLTWGQRTGPAWGRSGEMRTADQIADALPAAVLERLAHDLRGGKAWRTVARDIEQGMRDRERYGLLGDGG